MTELEILKFGTLYLIRVEYKSILFSISRVLEIELDLIKIENI